MHRRPEQSGYGALWLGLDRYRAAMVVGFLALVLSNGCSYGRSEGPLVFGTSTCDLENVTRRLDEGVDPNSHYGEPHSGTFYAAGNSGLGECFEVLRLVVEEGGDVTRIERDNSIFVFVAIHQENPEVVAYLLEFGADPCIPLSQDTGRRYGVGSMQELAEQEASVEVAEALAAAIASCEGS